MQSQQQHQWSLSVDAHEATEDGAEQWTYSYSAVPGARASWTTTTTRPRTTNGEEGRKEDAVDQVAMTGRYLSQNGPCAHHLNEAGCNTVHFHSPERPTTIKQRSLAKVPDEVDDLLVVTDHQLTRLTEDANPQGELGQKREYILIDDNNDNTLGASHLRTGITTCMAKTPEKGDLDNFLGYNETTVRGVTIQAVAPSPDKTASTVSWSASPDFVAGFPEAKSRSAFQKRSQQQYQCYHESSPTEKQHRFIPVQEDDARIVDPGEPSPSQPSPTGAKVASFSTQPSSSTSVNDLIRIQIATSRDRQNNSSSIFYVPVSLMLQREIEMQAAARINRIGQDRWSTSRVFRMWRKQQQLLQTRPHSTTSDMTIHLTPEVSLRNSSSSCGNFRWKTWLTTCIRAYYNTGSLRIPQSCQGDDILLALEYFGILTASTEMFVFESALAFERIQAWSRYFTFRTELAETLLEAYDDLVDEERQRQQSFVDEENKDDEIDQDQARALFLHTSSKARLWVLTDERYGHFPVAEPSLHVGGIEVRVLNVRAEGGLYDLFCGNITGKSDEEGGVEDDEDYQLTQQLPNRLRLDFCEYVRQSLPPRMTVTFKLEEVQIIPSTTGCSSRSSKYETKPVIRIEHDLANDEADSSLPPCLRAEVENPDSSLRSASIGSTRSRGDAVAASKASSTGSGTRWKMSECSTHHSPHTRTLAGEGISPKTEDVYENTSSLAQNVLFSDESLQKQPHLHENETNQVGFCIEPRRIVGDPTSPSSLRVYRQDSGLTDAIANSAIFRDGETKGAIRNVDKESAPIKYINTDFGDLRSVTSMLSEPVIDIPGVVCGLKVKNPGLLESAERKPAAVVVSKKEEKRLLAEVAKNIIRRRAFDENGTEGKSASDSAFLVKDQTLISNKAEDTLSTLHIAGSVTAGNEQHPGPTSFPGPIMESDADGDSGNDIAQEHSLNMKIKEIRREHDREIEAGPIGATDDPFKSWGQILASVCEAVIPIPPGNSASTSPTRTRQFSVTAPGQNLDSPAQILDDQPFAGCPCRQDPGAVLEEGGISRWVPADPVPDDENEEEGDWPTTKTLSHDEFLDRARQMGRDISTQLDALMKMAFDASGEVQQATSGLLPTIPEEISGAILPIDEEKPMEITTTKKQFAVDTYAVPKSQSFDSDALSEAFVPLPPHQTRRTRNKLTVARKKNSPYRPSFKKANNAAVDVQSRPNKGYPIATRDQSVSSLSEFSSQKTPGQPRDNRKMLT